MPLFRGFRFSLNLASGKQVSEFTDNGSPVSIKGAYKLNTEEFFGVGTYAEPPKKITPSMVKLPSAFEPDPTDPAIIRPTKSTSNLTDTTQPSNIHPQLRKSTPEVSSDPRGGKTNNRDSADVRKLKNKNDDKEQKRLDKKRQDEQKKREKVEIQERAKQEKVEAQERAKQEKVDAQKRAKQEKIEKERQKAELKERAKQDKLLKEKQKAQKLKVNQTTKKTPEAKPPANNPLAQGPSYVPTANPQARNPYNSNTLDSSISKSSGPPPYNEVSNANKTIETIVQNERDDTGNTSFGKPIDEGSTWDMVAQHRAQFNRMPAKSRVQLVESEPLGRQSLDV